MRVRSWMAALALIGISSILIGRGLSAQGTGGPQGASSSKKEEAKKPTEKSATGPSKAVPRESGSRPEEGRKPAPNLPTIRLDLNIEGLGAEGCDVEVKPANPSCKFLPSPSLHVESEGHATIVLRDVELRGADKTCSIAITVREPGREPQTTYRGFRIPSAKSGRPASFTCFISSRMAGTEAKSTRR
jgi:hypothetical protein